MAMPEPANDRQARRRPFSSLMKKLANFKGAASGEGNNKPYGSKKRPSKNNNPYPESGRIEVKPTSAVVRGSRYSVSSAPSGVATSFRTGSRRGSDVAGRMSADAGRSRINAVSAGASTEHDMSPSIMSPSHGASSLAGTSRTANGGVDSRRGGDSTFSSPAPSVRSLTTTLTTIQSLGPNMGHHHMSGNQSHNTITSQNGQPSSSSQTIHFNQPFPTASPASAIPSHVVPAPTGGSPTTYHTATANNLLTDNASILTLASSSKRRRRRSFDTDASVRALAPSSLFGGSRESLPLSVLSANVDPALPPPTPGGLSSHRGVAVSERSSFYAKPAAMDGASVRSGFPGHTRADSVAGSIGGPGLVQPSPLASPRETLALDGAGTVVDGVEEEEEEEEEHEEEDAGDVHDQELDQGSAKK